MAKLKVKKGDTILVIAGKDNGKTAEVLECFPEENKVTAKNINIIVKHNKPRSAQDKGGIVKKEGKIQVSDVMVVCPVCNKATRVKMSVNEKGEKVRVCKKCGASLDTGAKKAAKKAAPKAEAKPAETAKVEKKAAANNKSTVKDTKKVAPKKVATAVKPAPVKKASNTAKKIGGK